VLFHVDSPPPLLPSLPPPPPPRRHRHRPVEAIEHTDSDRPSTVGGTNFLDNTGQSSKRRPVTADMTTSSTAAPTKTGSSAPPTPGQTLCQNLRAACEAAERTNHFEKQATMNIFKTCMEVRQEDFLSKAMALDEKHAGVDLENEVRFLCV
jgi:hypothetical protein